jgi:hypothetical protein
MKALLSNQIRYLTSQIAVKNKLLLFNYLINRANAIILPEKLNRKIKIQNN